MEIIDRIFGAFEKAGQHRYGETAVSGLEHALQCALLAEQARAAPQLIAAALLHDIGHLINPDDFPAACRGEDAGHEQVGPALLSEWFEEGVVNPVRLHVAAKRYLTAIEPAYGDGLSPASARSLMLQGGPYTSGEARDFERLPYAQDAVMLRRWDDCAKVNGASTPTLYHFTPHLFACRVRPAIGKLTSETGALG